MTGIVTSRPFTDQDWRLFAGANFWGDKRLHPGEPGRYEPIRVDGENYVAVIDADGGSIWIGRTEDSVEEPDFYFSEPVADQAEGRRIADDLPFKVEELGLENLSSRWKRF